MVSLSTFISDLPPDTSLHLESSLNKDNLWLKIASPDPGNPYYLSPEEVEKCRQTGSNPGKKCLAQWGIRGQTVHGFLSRLQDVSRSLGSELDVPQLILNRKFKAVKWSRSEEIMISVVNEGRDIKLDCKAIGFPYPKFCWQKNQETIAEISSPSLVIPRCPCEADAHYRCFVSNEIPEGYNFSQAYRAPTKQFSSSILSKEVDTSPFIGGTKCLKCQAKQMEQLQVIVDDFVKLEASEASVRVEEVPADALVAVDKVALIISNCVYTHLPELVTPLCDAETLAEALQTMDYKTVTLADLTLDEMKFVVRQFKELLGHGVYAVFYFVGHGFEVNGQCYLLPVDAPLEAHNPQFSVSMDWFLAELSPHRSSLNLILLDMCRRFIPYDCIPAFVEYADQFKRHHTVNRNTVYGYSTSGGVGAYEVRGQVNGVFMTYLKAHVTKNFPVTEMLNKVLSDIGEDTRVYVLTSVGDLLETDDYDETDFPISEFAQKHIAYLRFPEEIEASSERVLEDDEEGISWQVLLSHLQRTSGELTCAVLLKRRRDDKVVDRVNCKLGHVLITRIVEERKGT